jgi:hypothetical protein
MSEILAAVVKPLGVRRAAHQFGDKKIFLGDGSFARMVAATSAGWVIVEG